MAHLFGPGTQTAVGRDFVMLDLLGGDNEAGIQGVGNFSVRK